MRARRRALAPAQRSRYAERLAKVASASLLSARGKRFACYLAQSGELDLGPLIALLWTRKRRCFLPVLHGPRLWFLPYESDTPLALNRFRIPEPDAALRRRCPPAALDVVLMPLVAFDDLGYRLGMGGGYYDRTFRFKLEPRAARRPRLIGVAYEFQRLARLPRQSWDVPLDGILTEAGYRAFERRSEA